ncbi:MAG: oligosaccharide flippase family protein [Clostridia bacterium]|nr:oligosaccharide flippase family protein [Clostridia bacterium]
MAKVSQLKMGAVISYVTLIINTIMPIIYTPIMLSILGKDEHGLYTFAHSIVSYLTLLSFGFGSSIVRYMTKYRALEDRENEEKTFGLFMIVYGVFSALVLIGGVILSFNSGALLTDTANSVYVDKMKILVLIMTLNVMISFVSAVFSSVIIAHEQFIFYKLLTLFSAVAIPCASIILLFCGFASIGITLSTTIVNFILLVGHSIYCTKKLKIKPRFKNLDFNVLKEIIRFSAFIFIAEISNMLYMATDRFLLGKMVTLASVSIYSTGATFSTIMNSLTVGISDVLMPKVTKMVFKGASNKEMDDIFIRVGRMQFIIVSFVMSSFAVFGRQFMPIFAGEGYDDSYWVAIILMVPLAVPLIQSVAVNIITARNKHRFRSFVLFGVAILNVVLTVLALWLGMEGIGAALASAVAAIIGTGAIMNWYYHKKMQIDIPRFWFNVLKLCPVPVGMTLLGFGITYFVDVSGIWRFLIGAVIYTIVYLPLLWITSLNKYEKGIFEDIFKKVRSKFRKGTV